MNCILCAAGSIQRVTIVNSFIFNPFVSRQMPAGVCTKPDFPILVAMKCETVASNAHIWTHHNDPNNLATINKISNGIFHAYRIRIYQSAFAV